MSQRKIAIVHYHLRRGGVTRVIESAYEALKSAEFEVLIFSGEAPLSDGLASDVCVVEGLNYRRSGNSVFASNLTDTLMEEAEKRFGSSPDVWHFHNPTLAKNVMVPSVIRELAEAGQKIVLQLHDFAEDGRPGNYSSQRSYFDSELSFESTMYPVGKQIHYAAVNYRDYDFLRAAGISSRNLHVIPNAIEPLEVRTTPAERPFSQKRLLALYPTRGIRRKNIGEVLLLAMIYGDLIDFATSLSPENPEWSDVYAKWQDAVVELDLPVTLGIADSEEYAFHDLIGWADFILTTSIAEGFGLAFLEPWTAGKGVIGRDLPEITRDFKENGLELSHLYQRIDVPSAWLDPAVIETEIESMLRRSYLAYDTEMPSGAVEKALTSIVRDGRIDFGVLSEELQLQVLRRLKSDPKMMDEIGVPPLVLPDKREIAERDELIRSAYSLESYQDSLKRLYRSVSRSSVGKVKYLPPARVLEQFLNPARLNLLRT